MNCVICDRELPQGNFCPRGEHDPEWIAREVAARAAEKKAKYRRRT